MEETDHTFRPAINSVSALISPKFYASTEDMLLKRGAEAR
jgi:hypothetical protein